MSTWLEMQLGLPAQNRVSAPVRVSAGDQMLKYGSHATSGTAGGRKRLSSSAAVVVVAVAAAAVVAVAVVVATMACGVMSAAQVQTQIKIGMENKRDERHERRRECRCESKRGRECRCGHGRETARFVVIAMGMMEAGMCCDTDGGGGGLAMTGWR
jgi:hypothetical protein